MIAKTSPISLGHSLKGINVGPGGCRWNQVSLLVGWCLSGISVFKNTPP